MDNTFDFADADFAPAADFSLSDAITPPASDELFFGTETVFRGIALDSAPVVDLSTPFDFAAVSRDLDVAAADLTAAAVPPTLPCQPYFLSSTTLESDSSPSLLFSTLTSELSSRNVDFKTNEAKFKIKGTHTHTDGTQCLLVARVWSRPSSDGLLVIEMQRRRGSAAVFRTLFNAIRAALADEGVVLESESTAAIKPSAKSTGFNSLPVPASLLASLPPITVTADSVSPLTSNLVSAQHPSIQRDAAATLASLAATSSEDTLVAIAPASLTALTFTLSTPDHELNSCSATATATILDSAAARASLSTEEVRQVTLALLDCFTSTAARAAASAVSTDSSGDIFPSTFLGDGEFVSSSVSASTTSSSSSESLDIPVEALASLRQAARALVSVVQDSFTVEALRGAVPSDSLSALRIAAGCDDSSLSTAASTAMRTLVTV